MPKAKSGKQQMAAGAALSAKRGERSKSSLKGASKQMAESMSEEELSNMASVTRKKLPARNRRKSGGSSSGKSASGRSSTRAGAKSRSGGGRSSAKSRGAGAGRSASKSRSAGERRSSKSRSSSKGRAGSSSKKR
jgi:hypothetical protein